MIRRTVQRAINTLGYDLVSKQSLKRIAFDRDTAIRVFYFQDLLKKVEDVPGDIMECGIGRGKTFLILSILNQEAEQKRDMWGFDSFQGFPEPSKEDQSTRKPKKGDWNVTSIKGILKLLRDSGVDYYRTRNQTFLIDGFFPTTFEKYTGKQIALLHLDVDLYESYKDCLEYLYDKVAKGGVITFDEYGNTQDHLHYPGAFKAINEFCKKNKLKVNKHSCGKHYIVKP